MTDICQFVCYAQYQNREKEREGERENNCLNTKMFISKDTELHSVEKNYIFVIKL